jgi:hypothetical protein
MANILYLQIRFGTRRPDKPTSHAGAEKDECHSLPIKRIHGSLTSGREKPGRISGVQLLFGRELHNWLLWPSNLFDDHLEYSLPAG